MRAFKMTLGQARTASDRNPRFLENPEYKQWIKVSDCSQVSDGASAAVLMSERGLSMNGLKREQSIEIASYGHATAALQVRQPSLCATQVSTPPLMHRVVPTMAHRFWQTGHRSEAATEWTRSCIEPASAGPRVAT